MEQATLEISLVALGAGVIAAPLITALGATWTGVVNGAFKTVKGLFTKRIELNEDWISKKAVLAYLDQNARRIHMFSGAGRYRMSPAFLKYENEKRQIFFRTTSESTSTFLIGGIPIRFTPEVRDQHGNCTSHAAVTFIRGTLNWDLLAADVAKFCNRLDEEYSAKNPTRRFYVMNHIGTKGQAPAAPGEKAPANDRGDSERLRGLGIYYSNSKPIGYSPEDIGEPERESTLETMSIESAGEALIEDIRWFRRHRQWYQERSIPYRRGYTIFGKPGTGKTSLARGVCEDEDIPVHIFNLGSMTNQDFLKFWALTQCSSERAVIFEDFDRVFKGRTAVPGVELTYDTVLNAIDGFERQDGLILIVTANNIDDIDEAMGKPDASGDSERPGRIDVVLEVKGLTRPGRMKMAMRIVQNVEVATALVDQHPDVTAAKFQEFCIREAKKQLKDLRMVG